MNDHPSSAPFDLDQALARIMDRAQRLLPFDSGGIAIFDAETQLLAPRNYRRSTPDAPTPHLIKLGEGVAGLVAQTRQPMLVNDVSQDERYVPYDSQTCAELAVPILANDDLLGVFTVGCNQSDRYTDQHLLMLSALADHAALALVTAYQSLNQSRRFERLKRLTYYNDELLLRNEISHLAASDQPIEAILPQMAERLAHLAGSDACALNLWDFNERRPKRLSAYGIDVGDFLSERNQDREARSITSQIIENPQIHIINHAQEIENPPTGFIREFGARAILAMPLIAHGQPIGAAFLMNLHSDAEYTLADAEKVSAILDQIALAIDNHRLLQDTQARLAETSVLLEIAAIAASSLELDDMLQQVLKVSEKMLSVTCGAFLLYDHATNTLRPRPHVWFGFPPGTNDDLHMPVADPRSHAAIVFTSGSPYFVNDLHRATMDSHFDLALRIGLRNVLMAPLRVQDAPMGVFIVGNKQGDFTRTDAHMLTAMGSHVAAALRNAELLTDTRDRLRETEVLQKIAAITSSTLDLDEMLMNVVREAAELLEVEGAILMMPDPMVTSLIPHEPSRYGIAVTLPFEPLPLDGAGHMVHVYHTGHPYVSNEPPSDPILERRNIITYPLNTHNRTLGTLSLINCKSGEFEESHVELIRAISSQIATSMENAQLFAGERARADLMSLINTISQELTATLDLPGLMHKVVNAIHNLLGYEAVSIMLLDESGETIVVEAAISSIEGGGIVEGYKFSITQGVVGRAIRTGETQLVLDVTEDADFFLPSTARKWGSVLVVPLRARTKTVGAIEAISETPNGFLETDKLALETLSAQVSIAIENARLWNQAQRRLLEQGIVHQIGQDLTAILDYSELVNAVVQHMTRALDTALCVLTSYDPEASSHSYEAEYRIGEVSRNPDKYPLQPYLAHAPSANEKSLFDGAVLTRRQVLVYRDSPGITVRQQKDLEKHGIYAEMVLPMIAGDRIIGCVMWVELRGPRDFTPGDVRLAQTLTSQAAIAIENARLFRQAQRQAREQTLLRRIAVGLSVMPDLDSLLRQLSWEVAHALEVDTAIISLRDENANYPISAYFPITHSPTESILRRVQLAELPSVLQSLEQGLTLPFYSKGADDTPAARELAEAVGNQTVSMLLAPIVRRGETIGVIEASSELSARYFDEKEVQLLESIANQGAIAIDNVSLSEREQHRLHQLEKLQVSSRNIAGQLQTSALLKTIVREAAAIFDAEAVSLMTRNDDDEYYAIRASVGLSDAYIQARRVHMHEYDQTVQRPQFVQATDPDDLATREQQELVRREGLKSVLTVPLVKAGQHLGMLNLYAKDNPRPFADEERELAQLFASQAATAMENARLFQALEDRAVELTKLNRLKSEFLARVSHELRTPMNSINGYSELLLGNIYGVLNEKQVDRVERIMRNGRNLLAIIDDLLDISKIDAGKMELQIEPVSLRDELGATIYNLESQAAARGLYLKLDAPETLPMVRADSMRLKQIITNLIGNAVKFTKDGGITVRAKLVEGKNGASSTIWTSVIDTGIGIRAEDQAIIFDEFRQVDGSTTREYGGTGLGLAITKKLVEMMQGNIWVESEMGQGSTFTFVLPVAQAESNAPAN